MRRRLASVLILLLFALVTSACGQDVPVETRSPEANTPVVPAATRAWPTDTPISPTATPPLPTHTPIRPSPSPSSPPDTAVPPTATPFRITPEPEIDFTDPVSVLQAVFTAARTEDFGILSGLCDPLGENDGDTAMICAMSEDHPEVEMFIEHFATGRVIGEALIVGDRARVDFTFGPDGDEGETMGLVRRDGRWYLIDF